MALAIGAGLAFFVGLLGTVSRLDRDRAFYPTVTIVVGSYYALFAAMGASNHALVVESLVGAVFLAAAVLGFRSSLWVVVLALAAHGIFDIFHARVIFNPGVPSWWPQFCLSYDVVAAGYLAWLLNSGRVRKGLLAAMALAVLFPLEGRAQTHSAFPVDILAGPAPQAVMADSRAHLLYELHLTNLSASPIELLSLEVLRDDGAAPLASYRGDELERLLVAVGQPDSAGKVRAIGGGRGVVIYLDLTLPSSTHTPGELRHRLAFSIARKKDGSGGTIESTVNGPMVVIVQEPVPLLQSPLRGSAWVAFNSLGGDDHRRALNAVDGQARIAQRFAIDWMRLGPDGRLFHSDAKANANFYSYGAEVLAVADGRISDLKDGFPENVGSNEASSRNITLDNVVGNYLILDLGHGHFALYAHLQPGSLRVKVGDRVKAGQALARLGNSGNSDAPHLHFQLMDANSPLGSEGLPYEIDGFTQLGVIGGPEALDSGEVWRPKSQEAPMAHRRELPVDNAVVTFP